MFLFELFFTIEVNFKIDVVYYKACILLVPVSILKNLVFLGYVQFSDNDLNYLLNVVLKIDYEF